MMLMTCLAVALMVPGALASDALVTVGDGTVDGHRLKEGETQWEIVFSREGQERVIGEVKQTIEARVDNGLEVWWIQIVQDVPGRMHMTDTFIVDRKNLTPISFNNVRRGDKSVALTYGPKGVSGHITPVEGDPKKIEETLEPTRFEGNLWGPLLAALPLTKGLSVQLPFYQYDQGKTVLAIKVLGETTAPGPDGEEVSVWELEVLTPKGNTMTYLISDTLGEVGYRSGPVSQRLKRTSL